MTSHEWILEEKLLMKGERECAYMYLLQELSISAAGTQTRGTAKVFREKRGLDSCSCLGRVS